MHAETLNLRDVIVFLVAAGVVVPFIQRLRVSPVLGFLFVGVVIGPYGLARFEETVPWFSYATISDRDGVNALAELGVVFLLFMIGLELSFERLWSLRHAVFGLGGAQVAVTGVAIGGIAYLFDNPLATAVVLGACFALSSTAIVMQLLAEKRRLGTPVGRTSFAILLFQDLAVVPILFMVSLFATQAEGPVIVAFATALSQAVVTVVAILLIGRVVVRPLFQFVGSTASRELFVATVLLVIIGTAITANAAGLSMALGAFLAGLMFSETEYRHEITVDIQPFRGLLLGLFFVSVGMGIDMAEVAVRPWWLASSVVGLFMVKGVILYVLARFSGHSPSVSLETSVLLGQSGEFAFVVLGMAAAVGLMPRDVAQFMLIVTGLTMIATPLAARIARQLALVLERLEAQRGETDPDPHGTLSGHVVVVGYGRVGRLLGTILDEQEVPHIAIDSDASLVTRFRGQGANIYFGDANRPELLRHLGIKQAAALVVTMDDAELAEHVVEVARRAWPQLPIYCRARDPDHAARLLRHGATRVIPEVMETTLQLVEAVLESAGIPEDAARQLVEARREELHSMLELSDEEEK